MRLLADENFPRKAVVELRELGHDVAWIQEVAPASTDEEVLERAIRESRVLLTLDKDFGELAFQWGLPAACGIILFRVGAIPDHVAAAVKRVIHPTADFSNRFLVVEGWRVRERPLPT